MAIGPLVRRSLGRFEQPAAEAYRNLFFDVDHFGELALILAPRARRVLEVGCGDGAVANRITSIFARAEYVGIDIAPQPGRRFTGDTARVTFKSCESGSSILVGEGYQPARSIITLSDRFGGDRPRTQKTRGPCGS